ncbi:hypothetical protein AcW1_001915 [Taiwanofungus camphoratus]|nr:hypothetical protein AcW1_001915 [Antrodia cinnamomea]
MTWRDPNVPLPDEEAFEAIKAGVDALPAGTKMLVNSGEFYGPNLSTANLELLARFFTKHPDYADKTFLSVKGGNQLQSFVLDGSAENLRRSVDNINAALRGTKRMDLFEPARIDPNVPVEDMMKTLVGFVKEGKFDHIGLSECSAQTLRRAHAIHPISAVEIEVSLLSYEEETKKVIVTAQELGVAVAAYSPVGRGILTGTIKSAEDVPAGDFRRSLTRFQEDIFKQNLVIVNTLKAIAAKKQVTPAQLSIAWVGSLGQHVIPIPGSSNKKRTLENIAAGDIIITTEEKAEIAKMLADVEVKGDRYFGNDAAAHLWG